MKTGSTYPRIVFVGAHMEAEPLFRWLLAEGENVVGLVTLTEAARQTVSGAVDLESVARNAGTDVLCVTNVNEASAVAWIADRKPDVLLVVGWSQLLHETLLQLPTVAALGFHASLLPKYRGRAPINWAIINGEKETGNTMIVLAGGVDEGDIVAQRRFPIGPEDTCESLYRVVAQTEVEMATEILPLIRAGRMPRRKQDSALATVMPKRRPEDGWIDWNRTAQQLHDWVRALTHPYPGAFTYLKQASGLEKVWIWRSSLQTAGQVGVMTPGTVIRDAEGWPAVRTGDGWLRLIAVQRDGGNEIAGNTAFGSLFSEGIRFENVAGRAA